jgi:hypothetical protein
MPQRTIRQRVIHLAGMVGAASLLLSCLSGGAKGIMVVATGTVQPVCMNSPYQVQSYTGATMGYYATSTLLRVSNSLTGPFEHKETHLCSGMGMSCVKTWTVSNQALGLYSWQAAGADTSGATGLSTPLGYYVTLECK